MSAASDEARREQDAASLQLVQTQVERLTRDRDQWLEAFKRKSEELAAALAAVRDWQGKFEEYGWHGANCPAKHTKNATTSHCDCGFSDLIYEAQRPQPDASALEEYVRDKERWQLFASSPQTALMLGTELDPNDNTVDWRQECNRLADAALARYSQEGAGKA